MQTEPRIIDELPTDESAIKHAIAILEFVGQAWINGHARDVDDGTYTFEVPLECLYNFEDSKYTAIHHRHGEEHYVDDGLTSHEAAPETVQNWPGPFLLTVKTVEAET